MASWKLEKDATLGTVTLGSGYTSGSGTMSLTAGHGDRLPASGDFWLKHRSGSTHRIWKCTARSTDTLTVTADANEGSGDASLSSGETLYAAMTIAALDQFRQDIHQTGADASKSAEKAGNLYLPNNGYYLRRDTGAAWGQWGPIFPLTEPVNGDFADLNTPIVDTTFGGVTISTAASATDVIRGRVKAVPTAPYTVDIAVRLRSITEDFHNAGIVLYDDTKLLTFGWGTLGAASGPSRIGSDDWTNVTTFATANFSLTFTPPGPLIFLRINDNNTNRLLSYSVDGQNWEQLLSETRTTHLTPTKIGMYVLVKNATRGTLANFLHWKES